MNARKIFILLLFTYQILALKNDDRLTDALYEDFNEFALSQSKPLRGDEFYFRALCFVSAAIWASQVGGAEETFDSYITQFAVFIACGPVVMYFHNKYFKARPSLTRELASGLFFLALRKYGAILNDEEFMKSNSDFPYFVYIPSYN